jgi:hypothetical protein
MDLLRYNSLPRMAHWVIDYPREYYESAGVTPSYSKPLGLDISQVQALDRIFVKIDLLDQALPYLQQIVQPWHLITGNGDLDVNLNTLQQLCQMPRMLSWSGHNLPKIHDKIFPVPIGFQELGPGRPNAPQGAFPHCDHKPIPVVITPFANTHGSRSELHNLQGPGILNLQQRLTYSDYIRTLAASQFSCCPRGNGWDTHRVLESIAVGSIPVVLNSPLNFLYRSLGCIVIDQWQQCIDYASWVVTPPNTQVIAFDWWQAQVTQHQEALQ